MKITTAGELRRYLANVPPELPIAISCGVQAGIAEGCTVERKRLFEYAAGRYADVERLKRKVSPDQTREVIVLE